MTFYVNEFTMDGINDHCIGLFDSNQWEGKGSCCGYYGVEYYLNTNLLAYGIQLRKQIKLHNNRDPFDGGFFGNVNRHYDRVVIDTAMWEESFEANSVEEAVTVFKYRIW